MSHGVHAVQHEAEHKIEHDKHGGDHDDGSKSLNKKVALLIAVLALFLAFSETLGKSAQTTAIADNIKASDTWNFFQAKTIRQTSLRIAAEAMTAQLPSIAHEDSKAAITKQIDAWRNTVNRYDSDPKEQDGRKELRALAEKYEHDRDTWLAKYHQYEFASAAFQIGIVLSSAAVITGIIALAWLAGLAGVFGLGFMALGLLAPHALHLAGH